ncbi:hypothetical protein [Salinithrix halophila]|uniref:Uncharacterized protein n=1 Tax=Salinithrix halophila TaxID=1485204 RepID=A0ABV8JB07_9BACL
MCRKCQSTSSIQLNDNQMAQVIDELDFIDGDSLSFSQPVQGDMKVDPCKPIPTPGKPAAVRCFPVCCTAQFKVDLSHQQFGGLQVQNGELVDAFGNGAFSSIRTGNLTIDPITQTHGDVVQGNVQVLINAGTHCPCVFVRVPFQCFIGLHPRDIVTAVQVKSVQLKTQFVDPDFSLPRGSIRLLVIIRLKVCVLSPKKERDEE